MEKIRLAFYKVQKGDFYGSTISWWTGLWNPPTPPYIHVEIGFLIDGKWKYFSSASRNADGTNGTRWIDGETLLKNRSRWDIYELNASRPVEYMVNTAESILGRKYDWLGIVGFATLFGQINDKNKWYCSESCWYVLTGVWFKRISPIRLFILTKRQASLIF